VIRKGGKEYYVRAGTQINNRPMLKKPSREKREIVTTTIGSNSIQTQNDPTLSKSVESNKNERLVMQNFETERKVNQKHTNFNEFHSFTNSNHTYTNNIER
jgi:hypothetical protein